jgi:DNA-binding NtrC family response regulator
MPPGRILVVEDRESLRRMLARALQQEGYEVETAAGGGPALALLRGRPFDLVLTDLMLPDLSGLEVLRASREAQPRTPVVVMTGFGTVASAVEAMKLGAQDFLEKPVELDDLFRLAREWLGGEGDGGPEGDPLAGESSPVPGAPPIVGHHPLLKAALRLASRVAATESTVLLTGESGTGKELFARRIHVLSKRGAGPWVALNCAAIPESLLENELFGHEKGAFTGADRRQAGRFELAQGGSLFLDEVGELQPAVQGKVLRVLEERLFERVGGGKTMRADVRLIAATNRRLEGMVAAGSFRSDLFFRLNVFPIELPPLRERASDIPQVAGHLLARMAERHGLPRLRLEEGAARLLAEQPWPGNVRELANTLERAAILAEGETLRAADLKPLLAPFGSPAPPGGSGGVGERERLRQALIETHGDKPRAAERLGMSYRALLKKVREHDLEGVPRYRE